MTKLEDETAGESNASHWCIMLMTDKLSGADYEAFLKWYEACDENRLEFDDAIRAWQALDPISTNPAMLQMRSDALQNLRRARTAFPDLSQWRWLAVGLAAAASIAAVIFVSSLFVAFGTEVYSTKAGERRVVDLADGSRITLDADTSVSVKLRAARRELTIDKGRANFEVSKDKARPFTVAAGQNVVLATGTQFSVERLRSEVRVVLYEGHVNVIDTKLMSPLNRSAASGSRALEPGQEMILTNGTDNALLVPAASNENLAWENGDLIFDNVPLAVAVERVNRYSSVPIRISPSVYGNVHVTGVYKAGDVGAFLDGLASISGLVYTLTDEGYVVQAKRR